MAQIFPFRGVTYNKAKVKDYSLVLTQPYDKIDDKMQGVYYKRSKFNHVRITKPKEEKGDNKTNNKYIRSAKTLNDWIKAGVLVQDSSPTIYAYYQEYEFNGEKKVRKGFIALGRLVEFGKGGVHPHERTLLAPKQDRFSMMMTTGASTGQVFMLYSDPQLRVNQILDKGIGTRAPDIVAKDDYGVVHKLWKIQEINLIQGIQVFTADKEVFIADGHHRYETALNYRNEMKAKGLACIGNESYDNRMMTFVNMDDMKGLTILPTHRVIFGLKKFSLMDLEKKLSKYFKIREYPFFSPKDEEQIRKDFLSDLKEAGRTSHSIGLAAKGANKYIILALRDEKTMDKIIKDHSDAWKRLDVTILHGFILEYLMGITKEKVEREENLHYIRGENEAIELVKKGKNQIVFLLNPTKVREVKEIAGRGERMPQKSTDFFPKLLSGIVISKINYACANTEKCHSESVKAKNLVSSKA